MSNRLRAGIIALAQSIFPVLVLAGVHISAEMVAAIMLVITNIVTLVALIFPGPGMDSGEPVPPDDLDQADLLRTVGPQESTSVIKP